MDGIRSLVSMARRRAFLAAWIAEAWTWVAVALAVVLVLVLERRLLGWSAALGVPSRSMAWVAIAGILAAGVGVAAAWVRVRGARRDDAQVAIELDGRIGSGERLSTAIALDGDASSAGDPFAQAAIADAVRWAAMPELPGRAKAAYPVELPARWWPVPAALCALALAWLAVPQLERAQPDPAKASASAGAERVKPPEEQRLEEVVKQIERNEQLAAKLDAELAEAKKTLDEGARGPVRSPEDSARESLKRLAELQERLAEVSGSKESREGRELRDALAKLDLPKGDDAARQLAEALKQGDFAAAKEALSKLQEAAKEGSALSKEEREKLAKSLEDTAKQLESLAKDPAKLAEALKGAGMDPALADNPAALRQAIEQSKQLNESQKEALRQMSQSMQGAQDKLAKMSQEMSRMSEQCKNPAAGQQGQQGQQSQQGQQGQQANGQQSDQKQGGQQSSQGQQQGQEGGQQGGESSMSKMLDEAETERQMAMASDSASSQCQGGGMSEDEADSALRASSDSESDGSSNRKGPKDGTGGGRGQAEGGDRKMRETAFGTKFQKQKGQRGEGDVIAQQLVAGESPRGESRVALQQVADRIAPGYERGTDDDPVPAHLREVHKQYFGDLRKKLESKGIAPAKPAEAAPAGGGNAK